MTSIEERLAELECRMDEIEERLAELECRIDELERLVVKVWQNRRFTADALAHLGADTDRRVADLVETVTPE